jgi:hypothetical protein
VGRPADLGVMRRLDASEAPTTIGLVAPIDVLASRTVIRWRVAR